MGKPQEYTAAQVSIVIPVHNRKNLTLACLASLKRQNLSGFKVVVVDDGSTDGTAEAILEQYPDTHIISGDGNLWWTKATNLGVRWSLDQKMRAIVTLNDDLEVAPDWLEQMLLWANQKPKTLLGSISFDIATKKPVYAGHWMEWDKGRHRPLLPSVSLLSQSGLLEVTHFAGRGLWIPAFVFEKIGLFDERVFPHYAADFDFTFRARARGYRTYCNLDAKLYSHVQASGAAMTRKKYGLKGYMQHLFARKGGGNLLNFTIMALRHCPKKHLPYYWSYGMAAKMGGYLRDWFYDWRSH
jgi:GT2 family glycosyltransferase